jgi:predicted  nucleic acid-binding Zn-ribbon protein
LSLQRVVAIVAAHNEADVIGPVVRALVEEEGVQVVLLDDRSSDGTVAAVEPWRGRGLIRVERFPEESGFAPADDARYAWADLLRRKQQIAAELDADWFIHHDADEFREGPWPGLGLVDSIARVDRLGWNAIDFEVFDFPPTDDGFVPGSDPRTHFTGYEPGSAWNKVQVRAWKKTGAAVDLASSGGHEARFEGRRVFPLRFLLRHYPVRSQAHGERKVFQERQPRFRAEERAKGWHVQYEGLAVGHRFLRDPQTLQPWDPDRARLDAVLRHREYDALAAEAASVRADLARAEKDGANYAAQLEWHRQEVERLGRELTAGTRAGEELHAALDRERRACQDLHGRLDAAQRLAAALHPELDAARREAADLHARLAAALEEGADLRARLHDAQARLEERTRALETAEHRADELGRALDGVRRQHEGAQRALDAIMASRTWRWSAAVRRLLDGGHV